MSLDITYEQVCICTLGNWGHGQDPEKNCPKCMGAGTHLTEEGKKIIDLVARHFGIDPLPRSI